MPELIADAIMQVMSSVWLAMYTVQYRSVHSTAVHCPAQSPLCNSVRGLGVSGLRQFPPEPHIFIIWWGQIALNLGDFNGFNGDDGYDGDDKM